MVSSMTNSRESKMEQLEQGTREEEGEVELGRVFNQKLCEYTTDGSVDINGQVATKASTGGWVAGILVLVNKGLATLAFFGVSGNLVIFLTRVVGQNNAAASNNVSKWTGTVYIFSMVGAFLSDSYLGRYMTCLVFQLIFIIGLVTLSLSTQLFMLRPSGCGKAEEPCGSHSSLEMGFFNLSIYLVALGNGGYQPNIATFGADQFEAGDPTEAHSKVAYFSYYYLALNLGALVSDTLLSYFQEQGLWALSFWVSTGSALLALLLFLCGTRRYRHFRPGGNPLSRVCQVLIVALKKWKVGMPPRGDEDLYELGPKEIEAAATDVSKRRILHSEGLRFPDRSALITSNDFHHAYNPWKLCTITQLEEAKCILRLIPIWMCTIIYSVVFTQMYSLFIEQGDAMNKTIFAGFRIPPASMSTFNICSAAIFILFYQRLLQPIAVALRHDPRGLTDLQRMGAGLIIAVAAMIAAGVVEHFRLKEPRGSDGSSLSILWQVPQYVLIGVSEVFFYVGQLEFFNEQAPEGLKSFGSALCMTSMSLGNFLSDILVTVVMKITEKDDKPGWIPLNLNRGHMDRFYFLLAALTCADFVVYVVCAKWYKCTKIQGKSEGEEEVKCSD